jgi:4-hydroxy-tetrahydrodipicolinate reductase
VIKLCVLGPSGRMGRTVMDLAATRDDVRVVSAVDHPASEFIGREVCGVPITGDLGAGLAAADVYIDFTTPEATANAARFVIDQSEHGDLGCAAVIGTTGLDSAAQTAVDTLSARAPVIDAPNFSLGVNVLLGLGEQRARSGPSLIWRSWRFITATSAMPRRAQRWPWRQRCIAVGPRARR